MKKNWIIAAMIAVFCAFTALAAADTATAETGCTHAAGWEQVNSQTHRCKECGETDVHTLTPRTVPSTCQSVGYTMDVCSECGYEGAQYDIRDADPDAHVWGEWTVTQEATCTKAGSRSHTCTICATPKSEQTALADHDMQAVIHDPDCMNDGYTQQVCSVCGLQGEKTDIIPRSAAYHKWGSFVVVTAPGCETEGEQKRTCSLCGAKHRQTIAPTGHSAEEVTIEPGCEDGYTVEICSACGEEISQRYAIVPAVHAWGEWQTTVEAGCETDGKQQRVCADCGALETAVIAAAGHDFVEYIQPASCLEDGYTVLRCSVCGQEQGERYDIVPGGEEYHIWDEDHWERESEPTCTEWGVYWQGCSVCGHMKKVPVMPKGHEGVETEVEPGFAQDGYKVLVCSVCGGEAGQRYEIVPAGMYSAPMQEMQVSDWEIPGAESAILYTATSEEGETAAVLEIRADAAGCVTLDLDDEWLAAHGVRRVCIVSQGVTVSFGVETGGTVQVEIACVQEKEGLLVSVLSTLPNDGFSEEDGAYCYGVYSAAIAQEGDALAYGRCMSVETPQGPGTLLVVSSAAE